MVKNFALMTSSSKYTILSDKSESLWKGDPRKSLVTGVSGTGGRNNNGRITVRHRGGGHKRKYREVDFKRDKFDVLAVVERLEYDPNRSAFIALVKYDDDEYSYIIAPDNLKPGDSIVSSRNDITIQIGNATPIANIPEGQIIHNIELKPGAGGQIARAAGSYARLVSKSKSAKYAILRLSSGSSYLISFDCMATIGVVSNIDRKNMTLGKAGRNRWRGIRPTVRGVAMNPVDHPHGGGEGKTSGGRHPVTPWGKSTKGKKTRSVRKKKMIMSFN